MNTSGSASSRPKARSLGARALKATTDSSHRKSLLHRIDVRLPWLKLAVVALIGFVAIIDLLDFTISRVDDPGNKIRIAPMSKHIRATERIFKGKKLVALTFDDGPSPDTTPRLLDILYDKDVLATFFTLGSRARSNPDIIKRAAKEGHEVASHTMYHQNLIRIPIASAEADIKESKEIYKSILGHDPGYTRPPYGNTNSTVSSAIGTPLILWSVDTEDWKNKSPETMLSLTMDEVYDGAIILMHDIYPASVDAVPNLVDTLRNNGYEFVTISELVKLRNISPQNGVIYYDFRP